MKTMIRGGIILGLLVTIFSAIYGATGMHKNPATTGLFPFVATLIEIVVLWWALRQTAAQGRRYFGQVSAGTLLAFIGGALIFATSYYMMANIFPNQIMEMNTAREAALRAQGLDAVAVEAKMAEFARNNTPIAQAVIGFAATVITGLVVSMVIAIFIRNKAPKAA